MNQYDQLTKEELLLLLQQRDIEKAAFNTGSTMVWEYDVPSDRITVPEFLNTEDKDNRLLIGLKDIPFQALADYCQTVHESQRETYLKNHLQPLLQGKTLRYNTNVLGICLKELVWLNTNMIAYKQDEAGKPTKLICYVTDISHQMENERIVNLFRYALSQSPNETYALDINGKIMFANPLAMERYGLTYPLEKHSFSDVDPYFGLDNWQMAMRNMKVGVSQTFHTSHSLSDGTVIPLEIESYKTTDDINGDLYWSFCQDLTERNRQTNKINSLNHLMDTILNNVPVVIHVESVDEDFRIVYFNEEAENFYSIPTSQAIGRTVGDLYSNRPDIAQIIQEEEHEVLEKGSVSNYAVNYVKPNGDIRIVNSTRMLVESAEWKLIVSFTWDITEKRENEVELMRVRQANKMKSAFLANMSHEIRTPLNAIVGFSSIIKDVEDEDERQHLIDIIEYNNELLLKLIGDILDLSKVEANEMDFDMQIVNLKEVCHKAIESNAIRIKPQLKVCFDEEHLPSVRVKTDVLRITQILSNLITNANKFTEEGSITIGYTVDEATGMVRITVTDTGMGIPQKQQESIFDRFVKLDDAKQGTGLGLSISKVIAEKLGGEIGLESELGKGSTFWITHPVI